MDTQQPTPEELYAALMEERRRCAAFVEQRLAKAKVAGDAYLIEALTRLLHEIEHPTEEP